MACVPDGSFTVYVPSQFSLAFTSMFLSCNVSFLVILALCSVIPPNTFWYAGSNSYISDLSFVMVFSWSLICSCSNLFFSSLVSFSYWMRRRESFSSSMAILPLVSASLYSRSLVCLIVSSTHFFVTSVMLFDFSFISFSFSSEMPTLSAQVFHSLSDALKMFKSCVYPLTLRISSNNSCAFPMYSSIVCGNELVSRLNISLNASASSGSASSSTASSYSSFSLLSSLFKLSVNFLRFSVFALMSSSFIKPSMSPNDSNLTLPLAINVARWV